MLLGNKTYIAAAAMAILSFIYAMGWIDRSIFDAMSVFLGSLGLAALRSGVTKVEEKIDEKVISK